MTFGEVIILVAIGIAVLLARSFLPSYLSEKGKSLATREDIAELTEKVESVKTLYAADLERLRHTLARSDVYHRAQYEAEFGAYREIWEQLVPVHRAVLALRPAFDVGLAEGETEDQRRYKRLDAFAKTFNAFTETVDKRRPFYPAPIATELNALIKLVRGEAIDYQIGPGSGHSQYWQKAIENSAAIGQHIDRVCDLVRQRLSGDDAA
jgi:hypothetical protein